MYEDDLDVQQLNGSVTYSIKELHRVLMRVFGRNLDLQLQFEHSSDEIIDDVDKKACPCLADCSAFVLTEAGQNEKNYISIISNIFLHNISENQESLLMSTFEFGVDPVFRALSTTFFATNHIQNENNPVFEAGGGSGFGFQVYCDDEIFLSAGFGGGGGILLTEYAPNTFGGGGGGGMQLITKNEHLSRLSIGGGGGCGTCDASIDNSNTIHCGFQLDDDSTSLSNFQSKWEDFAHNTLPQCKTIVVEGGGGGGGGTGGCCEPFHIGYGFRFRMTDNHAAVPDETSLTLNEQKHSHIAEVEDYRFKYDIVGWLLDVALTNCEITSNTTQSPTNYQTGSNWCCRCTQAQLILQDCLANSTTSNISLPVLCASLLENRQQVQWVTRQTCCTSDNSPTEQNGLDTITVERNVFSKYVLIWTTPNTTSWGFKAKLRQYTNNSSPNTFKYEFPCLQQDKTNENIPTASSLRSTLNNVDSSSWVIGGMLAGIFVFASLLLLATLLLRWREKRGALSSKLTLIPQISRTRDYYIPVPSLDNLSDSLRSIEIQELNLHRTNQNIKEASYYGSI